MIEEEWLDFLKVFIEAEANSTYPNILFEIKLFKEFG